MPELKKIITAEKSTDKAPDDKGMWFVASAQNVDSTGDVIIQAGLDWSVYHNPPAYLKILASHSIDLPSGEPPVVGRAEKIELGELVHKGQSYAATYIYMTWACDEVGVVTPFAQKYKTLYDNNYLSSFSIGTLVTKSTKNSTGGIDIVTGIPYEVSCVTVPANATAQRMQMIQKTLGIKVAPAEVEPVVEAPEVEKVIEPCEKNKDIDVVDAIQKVAGTNSEILSAIKTLIARMDVLESAIVVASESKTLEKPQPEKVSTPTTPTDAEKALSKRVQELINFLSK